MTLRFDLISIFPDYFAPLQLSLMGRATSAGQLDIRVHDLRDWTTDPHRSVDDSPAGGGAGMVMKPDVWGRAIDSVSISSDALLAIPTPSGTPLTQRLVEELAKEQQIVVACGRYEGIDARVAEHYPRVVEYSLGDYVLNGGEVAALALVEAVARLQDGFMGNKDSLVEESHSEDGLLEYPAYTLPQRWEGLEIPPVLRSGNHAAIARWRRDQSLRRTAARRPDLLASLKNLDSLDRQVLAEAGWVVRPEVAPLAIEVLRREDVPDVAHLAAVTFPDACPPTLSRADIDTFIEEMLSEDAFFGYVDSPHAEVLVARVGERIVGYTLYEDSSPEELHQPDAAYLSKCYVHPDFRGSGVSAALVTEVKRRCSREKLALATNIGNKRAAKFYRRLGFSKVGRRDFYVGTARNRDDVFVCDLTNRG